MQKRSNLRQRTHTVHKARFRVRETSMKTTHPSCATKNRLCKHARQHHAGEEKENKACPDVRRANWKLNEHEPRYRDVGTIQPAAEAKWTSRMIGTGFQTLLDEIVSVLFRDSPI
jgi:hypothetical protein